MKDIKQYIIEGQNDKAVKLQERANTINEQIEKAQEYITKKQTALEKLFAKYKKNTEFHKILPYEIFCNYRQTPDKEIEDFKNRQTILDKWNDYKYNPEAIQCIYLAINALYDKYPAKANEYGWAPRYDFEALDANKDDKKLEETLYTIKDEYVKKAYGYMVDINNKQIEIDGLQKKLTDIAAKLADIEHTDDKVSTLMKQVPELAKFIEECGERQYKYLIDFNEKLKIAWKEYYKVERDACEFHNEFGRVEGLTREQWQKQCDEMFKAAKQIKPKRFVETPERIRKDVERWKQSEREFLASRITTEFGKIIRTSLYTGDDGNVNGTIVGSLKTAKIETIWAGGYNIQRLHTRFLVHEK